jgi:hypothetical protein
LNPHYKEKYDAIKSHVGGLIDINTMQPTTELYKNALLLTVGEPAEWQAKIKITFFWRGKIFDRYTKLSEIHIL